MVRLKKQSHHKNSFDWDVKQQTKPEIIIANSNSLICGKSDAMNLKLF